MSLYELLLFLHIAAAIVWIGSGTLLNVQAYRAGRASDHEGLRRVAADAVGLAEVLFIPASFAVLLLGIGLTIDGPWSFGDLWVVLGLAGIAATIATGLGVIKPRSEEIDATLQREGMTREAAVKITQLLTIARVDLVVLYAAVADMALKPTGDDVGALAAMGMAVVAAAFYFPYRARAIREPARPGAQPSPSG